MFRASGTSSMRERLNVSWRRLSNRLKRVAYDIGLMGLYHTIRNRSALTVVIFHRVLPGEELQLGFADPDWTVTVDFFKDCLAFFSRHYNVISINDLLGCLSGSGTLPARPLLITFDDGWGDTEQFAATELQKAGLPAIVFVVAGAVGGCELWQEAIRRLWRSDALRLRLCDKLRQFTTVEDERRLDNVLAFFSSITAEERRPIIDGIMQQLGCAYANEMVSVRQLQELRLKGCDVGSHGMTHTSLTLAPDRVRELYDSRVLLARFLGGDTDRGPTTFSFPNGRYDRDVVHAASEAGYDYVFTSDSELALYRGCVSRPAVIGRVNISQRGLADARGRLQPESLAALLFRRPIRNIAGVGGGRR